MDTRAGVWRRWIWTFVVVQLIGLGIDAAWHGALSAGVEPETFAEMVRHLATVHLPLYVGVVGLFVTAIWAAADPVRRADAGLALPLVVAGATVQLAGEVWHAYSHLTFRPNPFPELAGFLGLVVVVGATIATGRRRGDRAAAESDQRGYAEREARARERMTR
jgi:hypothetical protein